MKRITFFTLGAILFAVGCSPTREMTVRTPVVVYQPSHQTDTGRDFNEADVCNGIVEAAMAASTGVVQVYRVWSHDVETVHHARQGSNTVIAHTAALDTLGRISGYAYELQESNKRRPDVFVSVHNNGGTRRHACWGFIHEGDEYEQQNRVLAEDLVSEICRVTNLENRGVLFDSSTGRNDYRCRETTKRAFYSLDENINYAPIRVLLEIGDNGVSAEFLRNPENQRKIGEVIQRVIERWFAR
ncbi:MAG: N-acetylmuramoyl-L-alanine amidase [Bacteroidota bacterium]